jgi:basic membrane protein A
MFMFFLALCLPAVTLAFFSGCDGNNPAAWKPGEPLAASQVKLAVIHVSNPLVETSGYAYAHQAGIREMQRALGLRDEQIVTIVNVPDTDQEATLYAMQQAIARGANIIIATSWGYMDACERFAAEYPGVVFAHASGYKNNGTNFTNYFGRIYQARYLSGIVAGLQTRTGKIGYVAARGLDNSEVTGGLNAFALGVESVNPRAGILVKITNSWFDPAGEKAAARALIDAGCDVIAQHCDTAYPQTEAQEAGVYGIGYNSDMRREAPEAVLTSVVWHWGVYYTYLVNSVINGSFTTRPYFGGLSEGFVNITPLNENVVAPGLAEAVESARRRILSGEEAVFFGALETNQGRLVGSEGEKFSDSEIQSGNNWYYHNISILVSRPRSDVGLHEGAVRP